MGDWEGITCLLIILLPVPDSVLQPAQAVGVWPTLAFKFDQTLNSPAIPAHFAQQVIVQGSLLER